MTISPCEISNSVNDIEYYPYNSLGLKPCNISPESFIRLCCALGYSLDYSYRLCLKQENFSNLSVDIYRGTNFIYTESDPNKFSIGFPDCRDRITYNSLQDKQDKFYVQKNGSIWIPYGEFTVAMDNFCLENGTIVNVCYEWLNIEADWLTKVFISGFTISLVLLAALILIYVLGPTNKSLHSKTIICYSAALVTQIVFELFVAAEHTKPNSMECCLLGYFYPSSFLHTFLWMNIICIDIWMTFSGIKGVNMNIKKKSENKLFCSYLAYSTGVSVIHLLIVYLTNEYSKLTAWYNPRIGTGWCMEFGRISRLSVCTSPNIYPICFQCGTIYFDHKKNFPFENQGFIIE